jgi:putative phage-type endonuclease
MYKNKISPKTDLEYLVHITINEFKLGNEDIKKTEFKNFIKHIFETMHRIDKIRLNFDKEFDKIQTSNLKIKPPQYDELDIQNLLQQIKHIDNIPKHEQRSPEWYQFRRENITASSIGYIDGLKGNGSYYQEIKNKCDTDTKNLSNPAILHGIKYEPVAIAIYERRNNVKILEYGCLPHKYIPHLAASPDGICDYSSQNPNYTARMLEIKCPYSRQITGIIPDVYFHQIQVQLEVCDLNYCDFLECKIVDFISFKEMKEHIKTICNHSFKLDEYGAVIEYSFSDDKSKIKYEYSQIGLLKQDLEDWITDKIQDLDEQDSNYVLHKISYWVLEHSNIVLVKRDRVFFESILPKIKTFWNDVEYFRKHREELDEYLKSSKPKNDYYAIDLLVNQKSSDSDSEKSILFDSNSNFSESDKSSHNKSLLIGKCLMLDSDLEEDFTVIKVIENKKKIKKSSKTNIKEHFRNGKKQNTKYKNISEFSGCMLD